MHFTCLYPNSEINTMLLWNFFWRGLHPAGSCLWTQELLLVLLRGCMGCQGLNWYLFLQASFLLLVLFLQLPYFIDKKIKADKVGRILNFKASYFLSTRLCEYATVLRKRILQIWLSKNLDMWRGFWAT